MKSKCFCRHADTHPLNLTDINIQPRIVKMVTDYDTSHELRAAEIRNLQNSFEEEISMVSLSCGPRIKRVLVQGLLVLNSNSGQIWK